MRDVSERRSQMARAKLYLVIIMVSLAILVTGACASEPSPAPTPTPPGPIKQVSQEESQRIAEEFVKNSPTFAFDGIGDTLTLTRTLTARCPSCWAFIFEFECRHAGYGDRTGQALAQVITPHQANIMVEQGEIKSAVIDKGWDMLRQKTL